MIWDSKPLIEALLRGFAASQAVFTTGMPLAEKSRGITEWFERFRNGNLPKCHPRVFPASGAHRVPSGQQRDARHGAGGFHVEVVETNALRGEAVDTRRRHATHTAVDANFSPAEVVRKDENDVGAGGCSGNQPRTGDEQCRHKKNLQLTGTEWNRGLHFGRFEVKCT